MEDQPPVNAGGTEHNEPVKPPTVSHDESVSSSAPAVEQKQKASVDAGDDEDSDFDELDGMLRPTQPNPRQLLI